MKAINLKTVMGAADIINGLKGGEVTTVISTIEKKCTVTRIEKALKHIIYIYLNDKDVNSVTLYIMFNKVEKISFNYNN